jgi:hypothetical protein
MLRRYGALLAVLLGMSSCLALGQSDPAKAAAAPKSNLTEEEREILKNREMLENIELFQNFEKIQYLNFLVQKKKDKGKEKPEAKASVKDNAGKNK